MKRFLWSALLSLLTLPLTAGTPDLPSCDAWQPAATCNYTVSSRPGSYAINTVVIHKVEGSAAGAASWFQNCAAGATAHYIFNNSSGYCYQSVREKDIAWHAGWWDTNLHSVGIEHGGYTASNDVATACYNASAVETRSCVVYYGVPYDRNHIIGHYQVPGCSSGNGGGTGCHTDPGAYWNWTYYMAQCNPSSGGSVSDEQPVLMPDGRLASVAIFTDGSVRVDAQNAPGSTWGGFQTLGGSGFNKISALGYADGRLMTFGVGSTQVYFDRQNAPGGSWSGWTQLTGPNFNYVAGIVYSDQRLAVAACGDGTPVYVDAEYTPGGSWGGWFNLGGTGFRNIDLVKRSNEKLVCFGTGGGQVYIDEQTVAGGAWTGRVELTGPTFTKVRGLELPDGRLEAIAVGDGTAVWVNKQTSAGGSWTGWQSIGGSGFVRIDPVGLADGSVSLFGVGNSGTVYVKRQSATGTWGGWTDLTAVGFSTAQGVQWLSGKVAVFGHGSGSPDWVKAELSPGGSWGSWANLGGTLK